MKDILKLFAKSLVSNNACIDGARKKPWYVAVIIFLLGMVLSVIPTSVMTLKDHADKNFDSNTYGLYEATYEFGNYIKTTTSDVDIFYIVKEGKTGRLVGDESIEFVSSNGLFAFDYSHNENAANKMLEYKAAKRSYVIFTENTVYFSILDPNSRDPDNPAITFTCVDAYKKIGRNDLKTFLSEGLTPTDNAKNTWSNFKGLIRKLYRQTRLKATGVQLGISSAINVGITVIMGFMIWILTRGKNNPYRLFTVWHCFSSAMWAAFTPGLLTVGLGFLIKRFASMMFPLLMGVRCMWLTMKSLRPDGSGYAAN